MSKTFQQIELTARPPALDACFGLLKEADPKAPFVLFGGAIRDTDYAAYHGVEHPANDYDLRVLLPENNHEQKIMEYVARLGKVASSVIREVPSAGTGRIRYCLNYEGVELDVSIRPWSLVKPRVSDLAIERAGEADIGLSSVAVGSDRVVWATPEYLQDRNNRTLTVYPRYDDNGNLAVKRLTEYTARMQQKFPEHQVIWLKGSTI